MRKILIACQCASNKGDRAIAEYLVKQLSEYVDTEIILSTTDPSLWLSLKEKGIKVIETGYRDFSRKIKTPFLNKVARNIVSLFYRLFVFPDLIKKKRRHIMCELISKEFIDAIKTSDMVIVTGGHHITSIRNKNALFAITYDIGLVSLYSKKYILWSQTIGPLYFSSTKAKGFIEDIIRKSDKVFVRDENSERCIRSLYGDFTNIVKSYDSVFGFGDAAFLSYSERSNKVGVSIFNGLKKAYDTYETLAKMLDRYVELGYNIEFFRMEYDDKEQEDIDLVISKMSKKGNVSIFPFASSTAEHMQEVASCRFFIGYKTHSIIMALTTATPLIAIAYHSKTVDFMKSYGLEEYAIFDEELTLERANHIIDKLLSTSENIHIKQREISNTLAKTIKKDFLQESEV